LNLVTIPIGKPIKKTQLYLLNDDLTITEPGEIGELFIGGEGQAICYRNQKELTLEKFIKNPFSDNEDELIFKTGDLCRMLPTGDLEFIGRKDFQLKIRGFRVEINEIESTIKKDISISQCLVVGMKKELDTELIAYITGYDQETSMPAGTICHSIDLQALKTSLLKWLPDYMVPNRLIEINRFPLNANCKIDRSKLPLSDTLPLEMQDDQNMTNDQLLIKEVWTEIFTQQNFGIYDNFFELGGHSLQLTKMIHKINRIFSVSVPIKEFLVNPTIWHLSTIIYKFPIETADLLQSIVLSSDLPVPLSPSQEQLWVFNELNKGSQVYNVALRIDLTGNLKPDLLNVALNELLKKHEALRTSFLTTNGTASQIINSFIPVQLEMSDVSNKTAHEIDILLLENAIIPFNLEDPSLIRWKLFRITNERHILFLNVHHIVFDGWSLGIFNKEIGDCYNALDCGFPLPPIDKSIQYSQYAVWQRKLAESNHFQKHLDYWKQKLGENPQPTELYSDFDRPALLTYNGCVHESLFDTAFLLKLKSFTKTNQISLYLFLLTTFNILLSRYTNKTRIIIGSPYHNRSNPEIQDILGMFINKSGTTASSAIGIIDDGKRVSSTSREIHFQSLRRNSRNVSLYGEYSGQRPSSHLWAVLSSTPSFRIFQAFRIKAVRLRPP
jgi:hypothetical protein